MSSLIHLLFGLKTVALFDIWSIEHVLSGISVGAAIRKRNRKELGRFLGSDHTERSRYFDYIGVLCLAFAWETLEHYLETGLLGSGVEMWFQGVEFWANRLITDPLLLLVGYAIARRWPVVIWPARALSLAWLLGHIFLLPDSMALQRLLFGV